MESKNSFSKLESISDSKFFRIYNLQSSSFEKLLFEEDSWLQIYGTELIRFYSRPAVFLTHLLELSGFRNWFDRKKKTAIYGAIPEGSFDFEFHSNSTADEIHSQYGPRQYLKSFSAFSVYGPVNHFQLSASVSNWTCSERRLSQALNEAVLDLRSGKVEQVMILASNLNESQVPQVESVFAIATNDLQALQKAQAIAQNTHVESSLYLNFHEHFQGS